MPSVSFSSFPRFVSLYDFAHEEEVTNVAPITQDYCIETERARSKPLSEKV